MSRHTAVLIMFLLVILAIPVKGPAVTPLVESKSITAAWPGGLIIDHNCIDIESIPSEWIDAVQTNVKIHYAHTSHGGQITTGLERIETSDATYSQAQASLSLPTEDGALCLFDGNGDDTYITPDEYWETPTGISTTQATIDANPEFSVSLWSWCTQLNYYSLAQVEQYLSAMSDFETANPEVTFVYMTCNAQASGSDGYNRFVNNQRIREYCRENDKVLFDFADLDSWSNWDHSTYDYDVDSVTYHVPVEHPDFNGDQAGHTTFTSCEQKGKAFWWMVAMLAGWNSGASTTSGTSPTTTTSTHTDPENPDLDPLMIGVGLVGVIIIFGVVVLLKRGR